MQFCLIFSTLSVALIAILTETVQVNVRTKRAHADNFSVLLKLFKMNPLKQSKTFKKFTDSVLSNKVDSPSMARNFDSNESGKDRKAIANVILKRIEKKIHETNPRKEKYHEPDYNIENINPEKFTVNILVNDALTEKQTKIEKTEDEDNFNNLFEHLDSNEVDERLPNVTKMLPISNNEKKRLLSKLYKTPVVSMVDNNITNFEKDIQSDQNKNTNLINDDLVDPEVFIL